MGALFRLHLEEILTLISNRATGDFVRRIPREHLRQRALAGAVWPHYRVHLPDIQREVDAAQNRLVADRGGQTANFE